MNQAPRSWLLPSALVTYVALSAIFGPVLYGGLARALSPGQIALTLSAIFITAFGLRETIRRARINQLGTEQRGPSWCFIGLGLTIATFTAQDGQPALLAAAAIGRGLMTVGALLSLGRVAAAPSVLKEHPGAASLDATWTSVVMWSSVATVHLLRAMFPDQFPLDPWGLQLAMSFASFGSLLLIVAVILRLRFLRGLQLGIFDRAWAALAISVAGIVLGAGSGFVLLAPPAELAGWVLTFTAAGVTWSMAHPHPGFVVRAVRGVLVSLFVSTPVCLGLLWANSRGYLGLGYLAIVSTGLGLLLGVFGQRLARPLLPEGARWRDAIRAALETSMHPEPEVALRDALVRLRAAEPTAKHRPEIFRLDPPGLLSVDIAGYLQERPVDFPRGVAEAAGAEPLGTLRAETLELAQVRSPRVRPLVQWFEAHQARTASVLTGESAPVGLLMLPKGRRSSPLSMEEAALLAQLCHRLAGLLSVTSALKRSRQRELEHQQIAEEAQRHTAQLTQQLAQKAHSDQLEAQLHAAVLHRSANSPAAQIAMLELESNAHHPRLLLTTRLGIDAVPWAAHVHLSRFQEPRPFVVLDLRNFESKALEPEFLISDSSPLGRARKGTLTLLHPDVLDEALQQSLATALTSHRPELLISCLIHSSSLVPALEQELKGPNLRLPTLKERAEDLQALVINELSERGLEQRGAPYGIERRALMELIERDFLGNDEELRGLIAALCARCTGDRVTLENLHETLAGDGSSAAEVAEPTGTAEVSRRTRARVPPRARRS